MYIQLVNLWAKLNGKKTLLSLATGVVYLLAVHLGLMDRNVAVENGVLGGLAIGLAHKVKKA